MHTGKDQRDDFVERHSDILADPWQKINERRLFCHSWQDLNQRRLSAMAIILLLVLIALAYGGYTGRGVTDSRDARFSLWPVTRRGHSPTTSDAGNADNIAALPS
jgi:hypothetical protein